MEGLIFRNSSCVRPACVTVCKRDVLLRRQKKLFDPSHSKRKYCFCSCGGAAPLGLWDTFQALVYYVLKKVLKDLVEMRLR